MDGYDILKAVITFTFGLVLVGIGVCIGLAVNQYILHCQ